MRERTASWYQVGGTSHFGYPQPEDAWAAATYDAAGYCDRCGAGGVQRRPFRFRSEPKAGRSQFLQLNWVFDELFVRPEVRAAFEREGVTGAGFAPAVRHRGGEPLATVEQLTVLTLLPPALVTDGLQPVTCRPDNEEPAWHPPGAVLRYPPDHPYCGRVKYHFPKALRLRRAALAGAPDVVKSHEWFGSGGAADRALLVSRQVADLYAAHRWRGLWWQPVELVD